MSDPSKTTIAALKAYDAAKAKADAGLYVGPDEAWDVAELCAAALRLHQYLENIEAPAPSKFHKIELDEEQRSDPRDGTVGELIDNRESVYGNPVEGCADIAMLWSTFLGHEVQAWEVPIMMMLMKISRMKASPDYSDHSDDIEGYLDIFRQIMGPDLIHARSVSEYVEQRGYR